MIRNHQFDREKMRAVILRACHSCAPADVGAVKLHKILYFLDMINYAHTRASVTGATYRKRPFGPTSDQLLFVLRDMQREGELQINQVEYHGYAKKEYIPLVEEPVGVLNENERELLDDVIDFVCRAHSAKGISEYSHQLPWELADFGNVIEYHTALLLYPSQPSPEAFELARQGVDEVEAEESTGETVALPLLADFRKGLLQAAGQS